MRIALIVAAGGSGRRFARGLSGGPVSRNALPGKLFFELSGKPVLLHSLSAFSDIPGIQEKVLVVPREAQKSVSGILKKSGFSDYRVTAGGKTRAESVIRGVRHLKKRADWILVHDGARPLVSPAAIKKVIHAAQKGGAEGVILASRMVPTVKKAGKRLLVEATLDRSELFAAETPQLVRRNYLDKAAASAKILKRATDEASILELMNAPVRLVLHEEWNPKITTVEDLKLAEAHLNGTEGKEWRTGIGSDIHRLERDRPLYLGGVLIPGMMGAVGHSDGDALLHAITDAVLGAMGEGDIGEWFSDKNRKYKGIRSAKLLEAVLEKARKGAWKVEHIDSIITLERPRLGPWKQKMRESIAGIAGVNIAQVSVKAKTREGLGDEGEGRAISCQAIVTMSRR